MLAPAPALDLTSLRGDFVDASKRFCPTCVAPAVWYEHAFRLPQHLGSREENKHSRIILGGVQRGHSDRLKQDQ